MGGEFELGPAEIATARGVSVRTARRWLLALEKQYGAPTVGRRGRKVFTTALAFEAVAPRTIGEKKAIEELQQKVRDLRVHVDALHTEVHQERRANKEFQKQALKWFRELGK